MREWYDCRRIRPRLWKNEAPPRGRTGVARYGNISGWRMRYDAFSLTIRSKVESKAHPVSDKNRWVLCVGKKQQEPKIRPLPSVLNRGCWLSVPQSHQEVLRVALIRWFIVPMVGCHCSHFVIVHVRVICEKPNCDYCIFRCNRVPGNKTWTRTTRLQNCLVNRAETWS